MNKNYKLFLVVALILCFLVFLFLRRKRLQENFECVKIDNSLYCIKEKGKINRFRKEMDPYYKEKVRDRDFFNYIKFIISRVIDDSKRFNYRNNYIEGNKFKKLNNYEPYGDTRLSMIDLNGESKKINIRYKYDYIKLDNKEIDADNFISESKERKDASRILTPGGVLFDKYNDDIIIFDSYRIRRFSYRDMKLKIPFIGDRPEPDYIPVLDAKPIEIHTQNDLFRIELCELMFGINFILNNPTATEADIDYEENFDGLNMTDNDIYRDLKEIEAKFLEPANKNREFTFIYKSKNDSEIKFTTDSFLKRLKFLLEKLESLKRFKDCIKDFKLVEGEEKKCSIKYQKDLPSFDMGPIEGKGVEGMQYDDDKPPTIIHTTFIDNRMEPWSNSWNNVSSEGIFSPLVTNNKKRMRVFNKKEMIYKNFKGEDGITSKSGNVTGVKQQSIKTDRVQIFNKTSVTPLARDDTNYFDEKLGESKKLNVFFENFENVENVGQDPSQKAYNVMSKTANKNKVNYGYPSIELNNDDNYNLRFSIGMYKIPDEMDATGIGMDIVDTGNEQIILVPDTNNNRIQVFKKDKSELIFFGQFGNLPYTSSRSLPHLDDNTRYEQIHDTENYNPLPGCEKTCDFDKDGKYQGARNRDFMNRKCLPWMEFLDENNKIKKEQIDNDYKNEKIKPPQEIFITNIRSDLEKGKDFRDKCQSLPGGKPVCIVDADGISTLSKCFPDYNELEDIKIPNTNEVKDANTCDAWMKDYHSRFGPIDANLCLGDNQDLILTPEQIEKGEKPIKNCKFECDPMYSYRRANIHQRQTAFRIEEGEEKEVYRKRGHFYSLLDEYQRCKDGIDYEKKTQKKKFSDPEFINPHFLGVDSQACIGMRANDGSCKTKDTRNTSGVDNCSLAYRKYLLKIIAATNQGQKYGQLFRPKSIAYDDKDKKYYVVDCYHHSVQCFTLEEEKAVTESGEKLKFVSADKEYNDKHIFYYDENFKTGNGLKYNATPIHSLGLRQNLIYEKKFENFSRAGIVSDETSAFIDELNKIKKLAKELDNRVNTFNKNRQEMIGLVKIWREAADITKKDLYTKRIVDLARDIERRYNRLKSNIQKIPLLVMVESQKEKYVVMMNDIISKINAVYADELSVEVKAKKKREKANRVAKSVEKPIPGTEILGNTIQAGVPNSDREYPDGFWGSDSYYRDSTINAVGCYHMPRNNPHAKMIMKVPPNVAVVGVIMKGRGKSFWSWNENQRPEYMKLTFKSDRGVESEHTHFHASKDDFQYWTLGRRNYQSKSTFAPKINLKEIVFTPQSWAHRPSYRTDILIKRYTPPRKGKFFKNRLINEEGDWIDKDGNILPDKDDIESFIIKTSGYSDKAEMISSKGTAEESEQNKRFALEKGFSEITADWGKKYSDDIIRLNRWVSGVSEYGNHVFVGFNDKIDYNKIREDGNYFFNTEKGGGASFPGCGEFSYPSDIAIAKNTCLGNDTQLMFVTDTGNNRVTIFKKYKLDGLERFRFYSFLGDEEEDASNKKFVNPISVCVSEVSGNVFVLEANLYRNTINTNEYKDDGKAHQRIKVYYLDSKNKNYFYSHTIRLNESKDKTIYQNFNELYSSNDTNVNDDAKVITPRITKIRIDDRGIIALTDINNNKVHLLKESISQEFKIKNIDDSALNKVSIRVEYNPYKNFKTFEDREKNPIMNHDRLRFIFQRQRVCAFQNSDIILSREYKTGNMPFKNHKKIFDVEDVIEELEYDNCWILNKRNSYKYIENDIISESETGLKTREETNLPNFEINKKYNEDNILYGYEDWRGRSLEPNSSYLYKVFLYNYNYIKDTKLVVNKIVQTYPVFLKDDDLFPKSVFTEKENYISLGISYGYDSKKYNPICFTIMRRIHNRTADICTKKINCARNSRIQLFLPTQSKNIYQIKSRPKFGRLKVYDIDKGGEFEKNLIEMERSIDYGDNKYLIFYSCEGGDEKIGGAALPSPKTSSRGYVIDTFTLGDKLETVHTQITYHVYIDITKTDSVPILFKDNETLDEFIQYYQETPNKVTSTDLRKLVKMSYPKELENGGYNHPGLVEYCDKGINDGITYEPIEMNQTYEYVILVSNPFKVNPAVNSFYYTTKPEKPYIHSVEYERIAMEENFKIEDQNDVAKVTWYYPKNRSLYWPLNFLILRKDISNKPIAIEPSSYDIDFTFTARPLPSDKLFRINKHSLKLVNNSDPSSSGTFKRRYNLGKQIDWRIKLFGTSGIEALINKQKYDWSEPFMEFNNIKFLDIVIKLKGQQQINNITCEETVVIGDDETASSEDTEKINQFQQHKLNQEAKENEEIKQAVEDLRRVQGLNFVFRLSDDYHGYYSNAANAPKTGRSGSLFNYLKDMKEKDLLHIYDELSNEMKIYSGDVGLRMDGEGKTLRSGDKQMLIDKIRHFAFILRQSQKMEDKMMGVECRELTLDDIEIGIDNSGGTPKVKNLVCKNLNTPRIVPSISQTTAPPSTEMDNYFGAGDEIPQQTTVTISDEELNQFRSKPVVNYALKILYDNTIYSHMYGTQTYNGISLLVNQNKEFVNYDNVVTPNEYYIISNEERDFFDIKSDDVTLTKIRDNEFTVSTDDLINSKKGVLGNSQFQFSGFTEHLSSIKFRNNTERDNNKDELIDSNINSTVELNWNVQRQEHDKYKITGNNIFEAVNNYDSDLYISFDTRKVTKHTLESFTGSISPAPTVGDCSTLEKTGLRGDGKVIITDVMTLGECCRKLQLSRDSEVAEFKSDEKQCELSKGYIYDNEIPNRPYSTLLGKNADIFQLPVEEESEAPALPESNDIIIPKGKSDWEIIKVINSEKRTGEIPINLQYESQENFTGEITPPSLTTSYTYRPSIIPTPEDIDKIQTDLSFHPTIVSLSSDKDGVHMGPSDGEVEFSSHEILIPVPKGRRYAYKIAVYQTGFCMDSSEKRAYLGVETKNSILGLGEVYSNELELGESIQETIITNKPPLMVEPTFKEPKVSKPVIKFFEPKEGDANSIVRVVGLKLDEIEYFCFRDVKVPILKKQERVIGNVKYQEYLFKPPSVKELNRKCWQSIEKYRALVWGYHHGYQIISSEGSDDKTKMFTYITAGQCEDDKK